MSHHRRASLDAGTLDDTTLHRLFSDEEHRLRDALDELRFAGVGKLLGEGKIPQIVLCGHYASGKTTILEALTHIECREEGTDTTFPVELRLRREWEPRIGWGIRPGISRSAKDKEL